MASYGAFLAVCGYRYDGPEGLLAFGPRMQRDNFLAAFTTAEGWGRFSQTDQNGKQSNTLELRYGKLHLKRLTLAVAPGAQSGKAVVKLDGRDVAAKIQIDGMRLAITFPSGLDIAVRQVLAVKIDLRT